MTLTGFIASARKPGKSKVAGLLKGMGFQDKGSNSAQWVFGKTRFRVDVVDFRGIFEIPNPTGLKRLVGTTTGLSVLQSTTATELMTITSYGTHYL